MKTQLRRRAFFRVATKCAFVIISLTVAAGLTPAQTNTFPASGNAGVGTTSPETALQVIGNDHLRGVLRLRNIGSTGFSGVEYERGSDGAVTAYVGLDGNNGFFRFNSINNHPIAFLTESIERMRISSNGNIGIGTANPTAKLHVVGSSNQFVMFERNGKALYLNANWSDGNAYAQVAPRSSDNMGLSLSSKDTNPEYLLVTTSGNVGIGTTTPSNKLHVAGNITVDGNINAKYQDLAEWVPSTQQLTPATVVVLDSSRPNEVVISAQAYDTRVAGVISAQPGIALGECGNGKVLVASTGRVRVKVDASHGAIQIGDLLVTSDFPGTAMKSEPVELAGRKMHMPGTIIGKALEPLAHGKGEIMVLLSLQ